MSAGFGLRLSPPSAQTSAGLPRDSVLTLDRSFVTEYSGTLPPRLHRAVDEGLRTVAQIFIRELEPGLPIPQNKISVRLRKFGVSLDLRSFDLGKCAPTRSGNPLSLQDTAPDYSNGTSTTA